MAFGEDDLGGFGSLTRAIGLTRGASGDSNADWFGDPVGGTGSTHTNANGFATLLSDDDQRGALIEFVDEVLGPPTGHDDETARWVPLFANVDPAVTVYAVLEPTGSATAGTVRIGVGVEHRTGLAGDPSAAPRVTSRLHVPIAHVARGTDTRPADGPNPSWLLLGREGGRIGVEVEATFTDAPPVPGESFLRGLSASIGIPTGDEPVEFRLSLTDLQLPGAASPTTQTLTLDDLATVGPDLMQFVAGLVRAQVAALPTSNPALAKVRALAGLLGLRDGVADLPPLPLEDIVQRGLPALVDWLEGILETETHLAAWLAELAALTGGTPDADRNAVTLTVGACTVTVGLVVAAGTGGHPTLTPWVELGLGTRSGAEARAHVDLFVADTGTGGATAIPALRAEAVFGADAGGTRLLPGGAGQPRLGSVHVGLRLDEARRPAFVLTLHDVDLPGQPHRDVLDLSSPDAALDAADDVLDGVLSDALDALGDAGGLLKVLLGVDPPGTIDSPDILDLVRDPVATMRDYWLAITNDQAAMGEALGAVRHLLLGSAGPAVPGTGRQDDPWRIVLGDDDTVGLDLWRDGTRLRVAVSAVADLDVLDDLRVDASARLSLLGLDLSTGAATFLEDVVGRAGIGPRGADPAVLRIGDHLAIEAPRLGVDVTWTPRSGVRVAPSGEGLALLVSGLGSGAPDRLPVPLPHLDEHGSWSPDWAPDWAALERVLGHLLRQVGSDVLDALADLVGWGEVEARFGAPATVRARLALDALLSDPAAAIEQWLLDLTLDCRMLGAALRPLAWLLSAGALGAPLGDGRPERPWRLPVGGETGAPGLSVWTVPGCRPETPRRGPGEALDLLTGASVPSAATTASVLLSVAPSVPDLADLLHGRTGLPTGLTGLVTRWSGTDGLVGAPATVEVDGHEVLAGDAGVRVTTVLGLTYAGLVASVRSGAGLPVAPGQGGVATAVVHVGCDGAHAQDWLDLVLAPQRVDATGATPATVPATGDGPWFVLVPDVAAAAADRPDHDGLLAQAERVAAALATRTAPVLLVGHGAAGAATVRATALGTVAAQVDDVVTVGTPWGPVATTAFETDLTGDALRLLTALAPSDTSAQADTVLGLGSAPARQGLDLVGRSRTDLSRLPSALAVTRDPSVRVHACFASLGSGDVERALGAFVAQTVQARLRAVEALPSGPPQEVHVALDLPVVDGTVGGLLLGAGARLDLLTVARTAPRLRPQREVTVSVTVAVTDGWLVGGPGAAQHEIECRWVGFEVHVPLDGGAGRTVVTLHEARAHTAYREVWTVTGDETGAPPEVRILLGEVVARLRADTNLAHLLTAIGLLRDGGLDPSGLDRLLHDPAATVRAGVGAAPQTVATALRAILGGSVPSDIVPTAFRVSSGPAHLTVDLAAATVAGSLTLTEPVPLTLTLDGGPTGAGVDITVGAVDDTLGGVQLVGHAGTGGANLRVDLAPPGRPVARVALLPDPNADGLVSLATALLPALLLKGLGTALRELVEDPVLDECLGAAGLLGSADPESGARDLVLPLGLVQDPVGWLRARVEPLAATVTLLDALARVVTPNRGATPGWPLTDDVTVTYAVVAGRLELAAAVALGPTIDGRPVSTSLTGGLSIGPAGAPVALLDARVTVDGWGLDLGVGGSDPAPVRLDLVRPAPDTALRLVPAGPGLGSALADGAESLVVLALNELIGHRTDAASLRQQVAQATFDICGALDLLVAAKVDKGKLRLYTEPPGPGAVLLSRLPALASTGLAALAEALDPAHTLVASTLDGTGTARRFELGTAVVGVRPFSVTVDGSGTPSVSFGCDIAIGTWGRFAVDELRLDASGVRVSLRGGPFVVPLGPTTLRPVLVVRAGVAAGVGTRLLAVGLAVDDIESVQLRWALDTSPPELWAVTGGSSPGQSQAPEAIAADLLGIGVEIVSGLIAQQLGSIITDRATALLKDVVFSNAQRRIDPGFVRALFHPDQLLDRLQTLAWNCATITPGFELTIGDQVTIGLVAEPEGDVATKKIGLRLDVSKPLVLSNSDPKVELVSRADWITGAPPSGLHIFLLEGTRTSLEIVPQVRVAGVGLRFSGASRPIVDLDGFSIDAIEVNLYGEAAREGLGGGIRLKLDGLSVAPAGGGGDNAMANSLMTDVGSSSGSSRPSFSPSLALQKHPGPTEKLGVTLRAGDPPGPWWLVVQRQLGPLYVERVGLGTTESGGTVTSISLLFTGQVSLFGLTAAVDGLGITWKGGDVARIENWAVDLNGLAVAADMAGVSISGGLLKLTEGTAVSYVGMLVGRFAAYGLSVFGGFTNDRGNASFFIFGGVNGPFGGPPMFFLTGIGGGLGINRGLRVPDDLSRFGDFPFIQALDPAATPPADPMVRLRELATYFPHRMGEFWFAAGISFTSFNLVDGVAVIAVSFGNGLDVNLFGLARMALPRPGAAIVSIELALLAHFSTSEGVFLIKAQLTDNSWLLYEDVRLTGGFAFAIWWKGPLAGQFVLTMGGYHPDFPVPAGYPEVPRLGLVWKVSDAIVIKGGSYFALTSEALMAGLDIEVSLDFGWVWAKVSFGAHGIVWFDPFWFEVMAYARISAGIDIDLPWPFGSLSFSISIGAKIKVWGPKFAGRAEFEIGPCTVPVEFGDKAKVEPETLDWPHFVAKYLEDAGSAARALSAVTGRGSLPTATSSPKGAPSADGSVALPFQVFAEFELTLTTTIPTSHVDVGQGSAQAVALTLSSGAPTSLGMAPMGAAGLTSTVRVTLERKSFSGAWEPDAVHLQKLASRVDRDHYPLGVWGSPKSLGSAPALPSTEIVTAGNRVTLVAGIALNPVGPQIEYRRVTAGRRPLPLRATGATRAAFLKTSRDLALPVPTTSDDALVLARATLFPPVLDVMRPGQHSALARASYRRDRVSPPRIAALTDGLAKANGADGERLPSEPVKVEIRSARRPVVAALMTSGVGAAVRAPVTTVSDGSLKRRPAPTIESVKGRLGAHLPVVLRRTAAPGVVKGDTVLATTLPRTDVVGAVRTYAVGRVGSALATAGGGPLVGGLGSLAGTSRPAPRRSSRAARADATGSRLRPGDLVVLRSPDAQIDVDPDRRPSLAVDGSARVVTITGRLVTGDRVVSGSSVEVPVGTTLVAAHADGSATAAGPGADGGTSGTASSAGWTSRSRLARLGSHVGLGAGCTLSVDAAGGTFQDAAATGWCDADELVASAREVVTRFAGPVGIVAVALTGQEPVTPTPADIDLVGATPALDADGQPKPPVAVVLGSTTVLVHAVVTDREQRAAGGVRVVVRSGGTWQVTGVLAAPDGDGGHTAYAERLARDGLEAVVARVLATEGDGAELTWTDPPKRPARRQR